MEELKMKRTLYFASVAALAAISFSSCSKTEIDTPESLTHAVSIKATNVQTRTSIVEGEDEADFLWSADDNTRFVIKENGVEGQNITLTSTDGYKTATLGATFANSSATSFVYTAFMAGSKTSGGDPQVPATQQSTATSYDPAADILVGEPTPEFTEVQTDLRMNFNRPVVINKMTLKGLTPGVTVTDVTISADKPITGSYNVETETWTGLENSIVVTLNQAADSDGNLVVYFVTMPVEGATLSLQVNTSGPSFSKTFGKTINFAAGKVTVFGVSGMTDNLPKVGVTEIEVPAAGVTRKHLDLDITNAPLAYWNASVSSITGCVTHAELKRNTYIMYEIAPNTNPAEKTGTIVIKFRRDGWEDVYHTINVTQAAYDSKVKSGSVVFGTDPGCVALNSTGTINDSAGNIWSINSRAINMGGIYTSEYYYVIGVGTYETTVSWISFTLTFPTSVNVKNMSISLSTSSDDFSKSNLVEFMVNDSYIGSGTVTGYNPVEVESSSTATGNTLTIKVSNISMTYFHGFYYTYETL